MASQDPSAEPKRAPRSVAVRLLALAAIVGVMAFGVRASYRILLLKLEGFAKLSPTDPVWASAFTNGVQKDNLYHRGADGENGAWCRFESPEPVGLVDEESYLACDPNIARAELLAFMVHGAPGEQGAADRALLTAGEGFTARRKQFRERRPPQVGTLLHHAGKRTFFYWTVHAPEPAKD